MTDDGRPSGDAAAGVRLALTTLTVLPLRPGRVDRAAAAAAMCFAPAVGALLGAVLAVEAGVLRWFLPGSLGALLVGAVVVCTLAALTRGLHVDGLADTADGLGSHRPPEQALVVMAKPEVGAFGVAVVVFAVAVDLVAVGRATAVGHGPFAVVLAVVVGRLALPWACTPRTPAARPGGLGATVAGTTTATQAAVLTVVVTVGAAVWAGRHGSVFAAGQAVAAVLLALGAAHALRAHAVRRLGGITGDVLGAIVELATAVALVVLAASPPHR
jgi:adenosylcobinamide-GDP ribazoletransferase